MRPGETPAEYCLRLAKQLTMSDHTRLWTVVAAARRNDPDPLIRDLHNVPSEDDYWEQVRDEISIFRREANARGWVRQ